jgi:hypothetical protein
MPPTSAQIEYAKRLLKQVGAKEPDWSKLDAVAVSTLIDELKKKRGKPVWYGNGQFSHWEKLAEETTTKLGEVGVDSGTLLLIDPAYAKYWGTGQHPELSYESVTERAGWVNGAKQLHFKNGIAAGVLVNTGYGDGGYNVTACRGPDFTGYVRNWEVSVDFRPSDMAAKVAARFLATVRRK